MKYELGYGKGIQTIEISDKNVISCLEPNKIENHLNETDIIKAALLNPIDTPRLKDIVKPGEKLSIITSDITRPMPTYKVMPMLLDELYAAGVSPDDITLVFALGIHRSHTEAEKRKLAGDRAYTEIACVDSDPDDCIRFGHTPAGTPVDITRTVAEADRRICIGNIEYHYFAGYSGGAKALMPGVSTRVAIQMNHRYMVSDDACAGRLAGNPVREDIEEAIKFCGVDFILNLVLDEHKNIIHAVAGHVISAHRRGCEFLDKLYIKQIPQRADIVIVSQGGAPKDINLYQTQKALDNAKYAVKKGGTIILVGACGEGLGESEFESWMTKSPSPEYMIERIAKDFRLGGHKAAAIAMVLQNAEIYLVSEMEESFVKWIFMTPFNNVQDAFNTALKKHGSEAKIIVMPYGGSTLPRVSGYNGNI